MPKIIQKKISREAKRSHVDKDDLAIAVSVVNYESSNQQFDADFARSNIKHSTPELWSAALRVQEFINENYAPKG